MYPGSAGRLERSSVSSLIPELEVCLGPAAQLPGQVGPVASTCPDQAYAASLREDRIQLRNSTLVISGQRDQGGHVSPPERVVEVGLASTAGLVPDMQLLFRLFSAPHTNQCLGRSQRQLASTPPAAPVEGVLVARGEVPVNVSAVRSVTTPRQPDEHMPVKGNAEVGI